MTHHIKYQYDEILHPSLPGLEIHVVYHCESEIVFDEYGDEESNRLVDFFVRVDGQKPPQYKIPEERHGSDAKRFLGILKESARQALWAKALNVAKEAGHEIDPAEYAEIWQRTGSIKLPINVGKPQKDFVE